MKEAWEEAAAIVEMTVCAEFLEKIEEIQKEKGE